MSVSIDPDKTGGSGSVPKDETGGVAGLTGFKINLKNALGTIISFLTNSNTAERTYTFPDKSGTVAMLDDLSEGGAVDSVNGQTGVVELGYTDIGVREKLTADRTYYVRADGNDTNTGLVNSAGGAFLTIQKAIDVACGLDISIYNVTIQVGAGTYTGSNALKPFVGAGYIRIVGNTSTPSNVLISTSQDCFYSAGTWDGLYKLEGMKPASANSDAIQVGHSGANVQFGSIEFGACPNGVHMHCFLGTLTAISSYSITGGAVNHILCYNGGVVDTAGYTITLTGTPAFGIFCRSRSVGAVAVHSSTYSGSATGTRYECTLNGIINANGAGANYLPGNAAGSVSTGGQYA
jgi:hypothetical protein